MTQAECIFERFLYERFLNTALNARLEKAEDPTGEHDDDIIGLASAAAGDTMRALQGMGFSIILGIMPPGDQQ